MARFARGTFRFGGRSIGAAARGQLTRARSEAKHLQGELSMGLFKAQWRRSQNAMKKYEAFARKARMGHLKRYAPEFLSGKRRLSSGELKEMVQARAEGASFRAYRTTKGRLLNLHTKSYGRFLGTRPTLEMAVQAERQRFIELSDFMMFLSNRSPTIISAIMVAQGQILKNSIRQKILGGKVTPPVNPVTIEILRARKMVTGKAAKFHYTGGGASPGRPALYRPHKQGKHNNLVESIVSVMVGTGSSKQDVGNLFVGIPGDVIHPENNIPMWKIAAMMESGYAITMSKSKRIFFTILMMELGQPSRARRSKTPGGKPILIVPPRPFMSAGTDVLTGRDREGHTQFRGVAEAELQAVLHAQGGNIGRGFRRIAMAPVTVPASIARSSFVKSAMHTYAVLKADLGAAIDKLYFRLQMRMMGS